MKAVTGCCKGNGGMVSNLAQYKNLKYYFNCLKQSR